MLSLSSRRGGARHRLGGHEPKAELPSVRRPCQPSSVLVCLAPMLTTTSLLLLSSMHRVLLFRMGSRLRSLFRCRSRCLRRLGRDRPRRWWSRTSTRPCHPHHPSTQTTRDHPCSRTRPCRRRTRCRAGSRRRPEGESSACSAARRTCLVRTSDRGYLPLFLFTQGAGESEDAPYVSACAVPFCDDDRLRKVQEPWRPVRMVSSTLFQSLSLCASHPRLSS